MKKTLTVLSLLCAFVSSANAQTASQTAEPEIKFNEVTIEQRIAAEKNFNQNIDFIAYQSDERTLKEFIRNSQMLDDAYAKSQGLPAPYRRKINVKDRAAVKRYLETLSPEHMDLLNQ